MATVRVSGFAHSLDERLWDPGSKHKLLKETNENKRKVNRKERTERIFMTLNKTNLYINVSDIK